MRPPYRDANGQPVTHVIHAGPVPADSNGIDLLGPRQHHALGVSKTAFHRIAYTEWGAPGAPRTVICVHGLSRQGRDFDHLACALAQRGCRVICPDLPGRGQSAWLSDPDEYGLPQYCLDMAIVLAAARVEAADWIGTSLGGLIGMVMASLPGSIIRRLVINDIGPLLPWPALNRLGRNLRQMPAGFPDFASAKAHFRDVLAPFGPLTDAEWSHLAQYSIAPRDHGGYRMLCDPSIARAFRPGLLYNLTLWRYWDAVRCPVLVLRGEHSDLLPRAIAEQMTKRGPQTTIVEIPGCGHAPALLAQDQIDIVSDWVLR